MNVSFVLQGQHNAGYGVRVLGKWKKPTTHETHIRLYLKKEICLTKKRMMTA